MRRSKPKALLAMGLPNGIEDVEETGFELEPLSDDAFAEVQRDLREDQANPYYVADGTPLMKGNSPLIRDHDMALYLELIKLKRSRPADQSDNKD